MAINPEKIFTQKELFEVQRASAEQKNRLCCAFSMGRLWATQNYRTEREDFALNLLVYVDSGEMLLQFGSKSYVIPAGKAFFIDCLPHQVYGTHGNSCIMTYLHFFKGDVSDYLYRKIVSKYGNVFGGFPAKLIKTCMNKMITVAKTEKNYDVETFSSIITSAFYEILSREREPDSDPVFDGAASFIRKALSEKKEISLEEIAQNVGYSKFHFAKKFVEAFGVPPHEFIIRERISLAKNMLVNTSQPIGAIALECGFFDTSHMSNCFKKREGMTPVEYRREWKAI